MSRPAALLAVLVLSAAPAAAQPPDPTDLARGLREGGMPDLALEYLDEVAAKNPSPATRAVLPLERARATLDLAAAESDDGKRAGLVAEAKAGFDQFLAANPNHPRRAEAAISLARVVSVDARGVLSRANNVDDAAARKAEKVKARPVFQDAAKRFGQAAAEFARKLDDPALTPAQKRALTQDVYQAELDRAVNWFRLADTYETGGGTAEVQDRGAALDQARSLFLTLSKKDPTQPLVWVALAWAGECEQEKDAREAARKTFEDVRAAGRRTSAASLGARTATFFELRRDYLAARTGRNPAEIRKVLGNLDSWLADPAARGARPGPEAAAARFYRGVLRQDLGVMLATDKTGKAGPPNAAAREQLRAAERDFKLLQESENDYTGRAAERRTQVIRALVGDAEKSPAAITDFEECVMTARVQLYRAVKDDKLSPADKAKAADKAAALYERARKIPVPRDLARDAADAQADLVYTYLLAQRPQPAAVLGEYLARNSRSAPVAARAGLYAVQAYLTSANKLDPADAAGRRVDQDRAIQVGLFLDKQFPADASTDAARVVVGQQLLRDGRHLEAFDLLGRVRPGSPRGQAARMIEGAAAYELLRSGSPTEAAEGAPALSPQKKAEIYARVVADLNSVPTQPAGVPAAEARLSVLLSLQLAELHLTNRPAGYPLAEKAAALAADKAALYTALPLEEKQELGFRAENARVRAVYAQAYPLFQQGRYADTMTRLAPTLVDMAKNGPAAKPDLKDPAATAAKRLDDFRRNELLVLALQCRVKEGAVDKAGELFDLLKRFGGSTEASVGAMGRLLDTVGPQIAALRKAGKADEADKLAGAVGGLLDRVANEPNVSPAVLVFLGRGLREIGNNDKAIDLLNRVPAPPADVLAKPLNDVPDAQRLPVSRYRSARLELARCYRQARKYADAEAVLADALGTKDKKGWGATDLNFRKEDAHLLEARAADTADAKQAQPLWVKANQQWGQMGREYQSVLTRPLPKDDKARNDQERLRAQVKPFYFDLFYEQIRCATQANVHLLKSNPGALPAKLAGAARQMAALEKNNPDLTAEVKAKFADLLDEVPPLKAEYEKQDGPKGLLRQNQTPSAGGA